VTREASKIREQEIQNAIREHVSKTGLGVLFRANVGEAWTGDVKDICYNTAANVLTIKNPRRLRTGLPKGFSDLFGVGQDGKSVFVEVKSVKGKPTPEQINFLQRMQSQGAHAGTARSIADAELIFNGFGRIT